MSSEHRARSAASCCVATTNIGYAYEHAFKLLYFLENEKNPDLKGADGHDLVQLYDALSRPLQGKLSDINNDIPLHDYEVGNPLLDFVMGEELGKPNGYILLDWMLGGTPELRKLLKYWTIEKCLQGSRYKYSDVTETPVTIKFLVPLRSEHVIDLILCEVVAPRLNLEYMRTP